VPVFQYKAIDHSDGVRLGVIDSDSPRQARQELRDLGLRVTQLEESDSNADRTLGLPFQFRRSWDHWVTTITGELATLLSVGVPLLDALTTLIAQHKGPAAKNLLHLKDDVSSGISLAEAMSRQPDVFDTLCVKMVEVGENTGNLDEILRQLSDFKQRSLAFKDRVLSALLYPMIIMSVCIGVSVFLMTVVVRVVFRLKGERFSKSLNTQNEKPANACLANVSDMLGALLGGLVPGKVSESATRIVLICGSSRSRMARMLPTSCWDDHQTHKPREVVLTSLASFNQLSSKSQCARLVALIEL